MIYGVILAGGEGTRLWPESNARFPKPFLSPTGPATLLEETINRIRPLVPINRILISTAELFAPLVRRFCPELPEANLLTEPFVRNTAPAIALAALEIERRDPDGTMVVLPSDHFIDSPESLRILLESADRLVSEDARRLVTIGISPSSPSSAYGYMKASKPLLSAESIPHFASIRPLCVESFHEKPDLETAQNYLADGDYYWNAGIFIWKAKRILELIRRHAPKLADGVEHLRQAFGQDDFRQIRFEEFHRMSSVSIDYAVLEKTDGILLLPAPFRWSDLGSFDSLATLYPEEKDNKGNLALGIETVSLESSENLVRWNIGTKTDKNSNNASEEILALAGVDDLLVVRSGNITLIAKRGRDDLIRKLAETLKPTL